MARLTAAMADAAGKLPSEMPHPILGDGMCKNKCGRPVAKGKYWGRSKFDTCCRSCAQNMGHDEACEETKPPFTFNVGHQISVFLGGGNGLCQSALVAQCISHNR